MTSLTFQQLGIPFELFDAPASAASGYAGKMTCSICQASDVHCFKMGIGTDLVLPCGHCQTSVPLAVSEKAAAPCPACGGSVLFPETPVEFGCYDCLRAHRFSLTKGTELGMIRFIDAVGGVTHGIPGLNRSDFEMVVLNDGWVGARLPREEMMELLRTPDYPTIQDDNWLFCCKRPMTFVGEWSRSDFVNRSWDGNGRAYFDSVVRDPVVGLWEDRLHDITGIYVFRCRTCTKHSAHWDLA